MAVKIRLRRVGRKKQPSYRMVVIESENPRGGAYLDTVGYYNPQRKPANLQIDLAKIDNWLGRGATMSETTDSLVRKARRGGDKTVTVTGMPGEAAPEAAAAAHDPLAGNGNPFSDPVFQDYVETADGYLNAANTPRLRGDFRDALSSPELPTLKNPAAGLKPASPVLPKLNADKPEPAGAPLNHFKVTFAGEAGPLGSHVWPLDSTPGKYAREYVFLCITPSEPGYDQLLSRLEVEAGFRFIGEKTAFLGKSKKTSILGWAPYSSLTRILKIKGVAKATVEKKNSGMPLKTAVRITLKVPFQNKPGAFVPAFVKTLTKNNNFDAETWFRLPKKSSDSRFSVYDITGTLPVDMVGEVSRSPFVASIEFKDSSL